MKEFLKVKTHSSSTIPLALSLLSAGRGFEVSEDFEPLDVNNLITKGREGFIAFILDGTSMLPHIRHGDLVFVDTWAIPQNGDTIVSNVNGQNNVKTFENSGRGLFLVPKNTEFKERQITQQDAFHVVGVVRAHLAFD